MPDFLILDAHFGKTTCNIKKRVFGKVCIGSTGIFEEVNGVGPHFQMHHVKGDFEETAIEIAPNIISQSILTRTSKSSVVTGSLY